MGALYAVLGLVIGIAIDEAFRQRMGSAGRGAELDRSPRSPSAKKSRTDVRPSCVCDQFAAQDYYDR
jgi:hypothetical protein